MKLVRAIRHWLRTPSTLVEYWTVINLNRFDLFSLRLFVTVLDAGSLTAGARLVGISLAAASRRIAELEQHCGLTLLERGQRGVRATQNGQAIQRHAFEVIARLEQLEAAVDDFQMGTGRHLRLWADPSASSGFLPRLLAGYAATYPEVKISLDDALSEDAVKAVHKGVAELAVIGDNVACEDLETVVCDVDKLVLLVPRDHPLARKGLVAVDQVLDYDLITLTHSTSLTRRLMSAAEEVGRTPRIRVQVRSIDSMCRMVFCGLGVAVLPRAACALFTGPFGLVAVDLHGLDVRRRLLLAMRRRAELSAPAKALVEMVEQGALNRELR